MMFRRWRVREWLIGWYGLFQAGHVVLNSRYLLGDNDPPFPGPRGGWSGDAVAFLDGFAAMDLINAMVAVVFAVAWLTGRQSRTLGTIVLTVSMYAAVTFTYATVSSGAWRRSTADIYLATWIPFVPVAVLAVLWLLDGSHRAVRV